MIGTATRVVARTFVARFRLRFLLQELDLIGPVLTLGRGAECQITLDDPLVSRLHAQLTITEDYVLVRDLGSRNGVRINGVLIDGETQLADNDRLRLGSQDLIFLVAASAGQVGERAPRATGAMEVCRHCGRPFPGESGACPHCGGRATFGLASGLDTITSVELEGVPSWTFRLIAEVIRRALDAGRAPEAERMLQRAARDLDDRVREGRKIGRDAVVEAAGFALRLAKLKVRPEWAEWSLRLHRSEQLLPLGETLDLLEELDERSLHALRPELEALLIDHAANAQTMVEPADQKTEQRLLALVRRAVS
jgi:pSer/pThr/pTyr-binding forkhead associated (FHA) protein